MGTDQVKVFISYAGSDRTWAEWVAWQLSDAGYKVELDVWNWAAGENFILKMNDALGRANRVVALFSAAYFDRSRYTTTEWTSLLIHDTEIDAERLVPVRVEEVAAGRIPAVLRPMAYRDLFGLDETAARRVLLESVRGPRRPDQEPAFPGQAARSPGGPGPRLPGTMPRVWNIPPRNPGFTGRDGMLVALRERLLSGDRAVVQALYGWGGVGKTQLAAEYAHQFAGTYDLAWWINAEQGGLIGDQFAALGAALACVPAGAETEVVRAAVLAELRQLGRWLLVFDNAENPGDIRPWLPGGPGHVLITSRKRGWTELAAPVEVDVLARTESTAILCTRIGGLTSAEADRLASHLGDLPLGIAQAAAYLADGAYSADDYLQLLATRAPELLDQGTPDSHSRSLAAATQLAVERLAGDHPATAELVTLCAFFGPEPIPLAWFTRGAHALPEPIAACARDPMKWREMLGQVDHSSLARTDQGVLQMHRLTQAILRERLAAGQADARARAGEILAASDPGDIDDFATWPDWARLAPHLLAVKPASPVHGAGLRHLASSVSWYMLKRGDTRSSYDLSRRLREQWRGQLGPDNLDTLRASNCLARALRVMGRYQEARELNEDTLARRRRLHGDDDFRTLISQGALAGDLRELGEVRKALELNQDNLSRRRRLLPPDDPATLTSATCVARDLAALGKAHAARELNEATLAARQRVLGPSDPSTLDSARALVGNLHAVGETQAAEELDRATRAREPKVPRGSEHSLETEPEDARHGSRV
jgi:hypothetical protein